MVTTSYQYPQYLYALQHDGESVQLPNGSWETPAAAWELKAVCREETNGKGSTIQTADGETRVFASLIQLPKGTAKIPEGTQVIVTREKVDVSQLSNTEFVEAAKATGLVVVPELAKSSTSAGFIAGYGFNTKRYAEYRNR